MKACTTGEGLHKQQYPLLVSTPYGEGAVLRTRSDGTQEIELMTWGKKAGGTMTRTNPTMLYSTTVFPPISPTSIGAEVVCFYGRGKLIDIRNDDDDMLVVQLSSWRLANRSRVICYLQKECVKCVRPKELHEMNVYERVEYALERKKIAAHEFAAKHYSAALQIYTQAVEAVRAVQHTSESNNAIRADLLVVMITCSNNAATCCLKLGRVNDAQQHATASLLLLEALEPKKGGKIHQELLAQGQSDVQVFGEWKVKSFIVTARALAEKGQVEEAMETVRNARKVIASYTKNNNNNASDKLSVKRLHTNDKELLTLLTNLKERRKAQLAKEKQYAQAMFRPSSSSKPLRAESPPSSGTCSTTMMKPSSPRSAATNDVTSAPSSTKERDMMTSNGEKEVPVKKKVSFADQNGRSHKKNMDKEIPWHKDAALLGGLGVMVGSLGAVLLLSQLLRRK